MPCDPLPHLAFKTALLDFPGGPVAKTQSFQWKGPGSNPGQGNRIHVSQVQVQSSQATTRDPVCLN